MVFDLAFILSPPLRYSVHPRSFTIQWWSCFPKNSLTVLFLFTFLCTHTFRRILSSSLLSGSKVVAFLGLYLLCFSLSLRKGIRTKYTLWNGLSLDFSCFAEWFCSGFLQLQIVCLLHTVFGPYVFGIQGYLFLGITKGLYQNFFLPNMPKLSWHFLHLWPFRLIETLLTTVMR